MPSIAKTLPVWQARALLVVAAKERHEVAAALEHHIKTDTDLGIAARMFGVSYMAVWRAKQKLPKIGKAVADYIAKHPDEEDSI